MKLFCLVVVSTCISVSFAEYGEVMISGGGNSGMLEVKQRDGRWGTVCYRGFGYYAANVACKQLGYDYGYYDSTSFYDEYKPVAICEVDCSGYENRLIDCDITDIFCDSCARHQYVSISCYDNYDYDHDSSGASSGAVGGVVGGLIVFGLIFFIVVCRIYIRYSYIRNNQNRTYVVTQQQAPRLLIARETRTFSSGPQPPPSYTPSDPNTGYYNPVPPDNYQPVATTDYAPVEPTNTPSVPPDNVPSDPPPAYTPTVSTNKSVPVPTDDSAQ